MVLRPVAEFWLPKAGNFPEECEDAFRCAYPPDEDPGPALIAVADGASESAFAREWANALADAFTARPPQFDGLTEDGLKEWLAPAQEEWSAGIPWDRLPWHGEAKARAGAFATLLGLVVDAPPGSEGPLSWRALAVGDSCLFIVRDGRLLRSFPLEDAALFDNNPDLLCSNPANAGALWEAVRLDDGECAEGDLFILASDALSCWFLAASAAGEKPWETLAALAPPDWDAWVGERRAEGLMRNDDVALVMFEVAPATG